jgi:hypothetical protein
MNDKPLSTLEEMAFPSFSAVCRVAGLTHVGSVVSGSACSVTFEGPVSALTVYFEPGAGVWVQVGQVHRDGRGGRALREFYDLSFFLDERASSEQRTSAFGSIDDPGVRMAVAELARQTAAYAMDVLSGDFAVLPKIRARAEENLRITEAQLYGSDAGNKRQH